LKGIPWNKQRRRIDEVMEICDLSRKAKRKIIGTLSKGFKQRVGIADAILAEPEVTILDEPTIGLDPHQIISIRNLLNSLRGKTTVIISSHILSEVEVCCDRVIILNSGHLVATGTTDQLREEFLPGSLFQLEAKGDEDSIRSVVENLCAEADMSLDTSYHPTGDEYKRYRISTTANGKELDGIISRLYENNTAQVKSLTKIKPGLEDVFLAATKRSWEMKRTQVTTDQVTETSTPKDSKAS